MILEVPDELVQQLFTVYKEATLTKIQNAFKKLWTKGMMPKGTFEILCEQISTQTL